MIVIKQTLGTNNYKLGKEIINPYHINRDLFTITKKGDEDIKLDEKAQIKTSKERTDFTYDITHNNKEIRNSKANTSIYLYHAKHVVSKNVNP